MAETLSYPQSPPWFHPQTDQMSPLTITKLKCSNQRKKHGSWGRKNIRSAQKRRNYDRHSRKPTFQVGGRVFLYTPLAKSGPGYKFALPHKGPYRVIEISENVACIQLIGQPGTDILRIAVDRLRHCPNECRRDDESHDIHTNHTETVNPLPQKPDSVPLPTDAGEPRTSPWHNRLRKLAVDKTQC